MTQDYDELAKELLSLNLNMLHVPAKRKIGKMAQGEVFVLNAGETLIMPKDIPHAVYGEERFKMQLTVSF